MALLLGIDTGGTFTDAVLVDDLAANGREAILATAKSPTTHHDLAIGINGAVRAVLATVAVAAEAIDLVSVSTTLATNALVEGHGEAAGLISIGFSYSDLERAGVTNVVQDDHLVLLAGGHDAHGNEREPLSEDQVVAAARRVAAGVSSFAITSQFSVRNPNHERQAAAMVRETTGLPVTMSHVLSARLDGPRRALTTALNARLLATIDRLNRALDSVLASAGIDAPLMVVRGDGSLVTAEFAGLRPIETILSGPAASVIGALHLGRSERGLVADIGGTTTDVAVVNDGRPTIAEHGAVVGGLRTMVEAVDMATIGLGGDSEVRIDIRAADGPLLLGPERAIPIGRLITEHPSIADELHRQLAAPIGLTTHGRFLMATSVEPGTPGDNREQGVLDRLADGPLPESVAAPSGLDGRAAARLRTRGLVRVATLTPTDAHAALHGLEGVDRDGSALVAEVLARQTSSTGGTIAASGDELCRSVIAALVRRSAAFSIQVALAADGLPVELNDPLIQAALDHHKATADIGIRLDYPLVGIGAPAASWYPLVAGLARTEPLIPDNYDVANAVGAVVGRVRVRCSCTITQPTKGQFRVHLDEQPTFGSVGNARDAARTRLETSALADAESAGAATPDLNEIWNETTAMVEGKEVFVEATLTIEASGRPRL